MSETRFEAASKGYGTYRDATAAGDSTFRRAIVRLEPAP
jgi:hypothetical protein